MDNFLISLKAVFPFIFYIGFGYLARRIGAVRDDFLKEMNNMVFRLFFPFVTFYNFCQIGDDLTNMPRLLFACLATLFLVILAALSIVPRLVREDPKRGVVIQAIYRSNAVLFAIPLVHNIFGSEAEAPAAMVVTVVVPIYNVVSVLILARFGSADVTASGMVKKILTNPLIDGAIAGLILYLLPFNLPEILVGPVSVIASLATPLALFILGGTLHFDEIYGNLKILSAALTVKLILVPAITILISMLLGFDRIESFVYFVIFATPIAASSFPMAAAMGGDSALAGQFVVLSTVLSTLTLFMWIFVMRMVGII